MVISPEAGKPYGTASAPMRRLQPWRPGDATDFTREIAKSNGLTLSYTRHAREQMDARDLTVGDVLYVLKNGFVHAEAQPSTQAGLYKYRMESRSPNSNNRIVGVVAIPDVERCWIKVITVMWVDE